MALAFGPVGAARAAGPGSLDPGFGGGVVALGGGTQLFGVAVAPNDEVVAAGQSGGAVLVARFTAAGRPDGQAVGGPGTARAVALQSDGKFVVAGASGGMFAERFNADGSVDRSFGFGGVAKASAFGGSGVANAVAVGSDGKIVVAGSVPFADPNGGVSTRVAVARLNANGRLDTSFGSGGTEVVDLGLPAAVAQGVAVQPDGKVVLVGYEQGSVNYGFFNAIVARLDSNGSLDPSFAGGVLSYHHPGGGYDSLNAVALQNDGKIVTGGVDLENTPFALFLRVNSDGTLDQSFGSGGATTLSSGNTLTESPVGANGVGIAGGGRIVGAGAFRDNGEFHVGLWALTPSGAPDPQLAGGSGIVEQQGGAEACALAVAPDGSLVVAGDTVSPIQPEDATPCSVNGSSSGFAARYTGYGPPPGPLPSPPFTAAPTVSGGSAKAITEVSAVAGGQVNPNGLASSYQFQYGPTTAYGSTSSSATITAGTVPVPASAVLRRLRPRTTYHYRLVATNADGPAYGPDETFRTLAPLRASLRGVHRSYRTFAVSRSGLVVRVGCSAPCSIRGSLLVSSSTAKQLALGQHRLAIGGGSARLRHAGTARLHLRLTSKAKRALARLRQLSVTLSVVAAPAGGGHAPRFTKTVMFTR